MCWPTYCLTNMSMEIVPRKEASKFLGRILILIGPHYIESFEKKTSQTYLFKMG